MFWESRMPVSSWGSWGLRPCSGAQTVKPSRQLWDFNHNDALPLKTLHLQFRWVSYFVFFSGLIPIARQIIKVSSPVYHLGGGGGHI